MTTMGWIILMVIIIVGMMIIAAAVLVIRGGNENEADDDLRCWCVELWHIGTGYQVRLCFSQTCIIGRVTLCENAVGSVPPVMDVTISREHGVLVNQDGVLVLHNLSSVNPMKLNGYVLNVPANLREGDRIEMGESTFLITKAELA